MAAAAVGGMLASGRPTGVAAVDGTLRAGTAVLVVALAVRSRPWASVAASGLAVGFAGQLDIQLFALGLFAVTSVAAFTRRAGGLVGAAVGASLGQILLRLGDLGGHGRCSIVAAGAIGILAVSVGVAGESAQRVRVVQISLGALIPVIAALDIYLIVIVQARAAVSSGIAAAEVGLAAAQRGDGMAAAELLTNAGVRLGRAHDAFGAWWARPVRAIPVVGQHARVLHDLTGALAELAAPASAVARLSAAPALRPRRGGVDPTALATLRRPLQESLATLDSVVAALNKARSPWLAAGANQRLDRLAATMTAAARDGRTLAAAVDVLPGLLGANGPRRYFLAVQNPAEQRASGGIIGAFGELAVTDGQLRLARLGTNAELDPPGAASTRTLSGPNDYVSRYRGFGPDKYFLNATLSPDFPTVARTISELYPQSGGAPVDGVISVDPLALAGLLTITGPVAVPGLGPSLTADNVVPILLNEQYLQLEGSTRDQFLLDASRAIFDQVTTVDMPSPGRLLAALAPAVAGKHLLVYSADPTEQRFLDRIGSSGSVRPVEHDFVQVVTQNNGQSKIDWYQRRSVSYDATYDSGTGELRSTLRLGVTNDAPATGAPAYVTGGQVSQPGESRVWVSVYSPLNLDAVTVDGRPTLWEGERELRRNVYSGFLAIAPGATAEVELHLTGIVDPGRLYRLHIGSQATITPDQLDVSVRGVGPLQAIASRNLGRHTQQTDLDVAVLFGDR